MKRKNIQIKSFLILPQKNYKSRKKETYRTAPIINLIKDGIEKVFLFKELMFIDLLVEKANDYKRKKKHF